jgi:hypothetical protein
MKVRAIVTAAVVGAALFAATPVRQAEAASPASPAAVFCALGFVCLQPTAGGQPIQIPAGQSRTFTGGIKVSSFANLTELDYCVLGSPSFGLPAFSALDREQPVSAVGPGSICLT